MCNTISSAYILYFSKVYDWSNVDKGRRYIENRIGERTEPMGHRNLVDRVEKMKN